MNLSETLTVDYEFFTYKFPKKSIVLVDDDLYAHLQDRYPMVFDFEPKKTKDPVKKADKVKTGAKFKPAITDDMVVKTFETEDFGVPQSGTVDSDGIQWEGEGVQEETL